MKIRVLLTCLLVLQGWTLPSAGAQDEANDELISMVIEFMSDGDKDIRGLAFEQVRTKAPGESATRRFAEQLTELPPEGQIGLLRALADRGDVVAKPAVLALIESQPDDELQVAALQALGKLGDASDIDRLVATLESSQTSIKKASRQALVQLRGDGVVRDLLQLIQPGTPRTTTLIEILTERRALEAIPRLLELSVGSDPQVRTAAMNALGKLASDEHVAAMAQGVLRAEPGRERSQAEKNVMFVCNRIDDVDARALPLLDTMKSMKNDDRVALLPTLGRVGGKPALAEVEKAIASRNSTQHAQGVRAIANWPDASVASRLSSLAKSDRHPSHQRTLRMALIRVAPLPDGRTDAEKLALLKQGMKLAATEEERNYALRRAAAIRLPETLRFVLPYIDQSAYTKQACQTVVELAHDRGLRDDNKAEFHAALDKVLETTQDATLIDRAHRYKRGQTWVRPK